MLLRVFHDIWVVKEQVNLVQDDGGKVRVQLMYLQDFYHEVADILETEVLGKLVGIVEVLFRYEKITSHCQVVATSNTGSLLTT